MNLLLRTTSLFMALAMIFTGCASTKSATDFNGLKSPDGDPIAHLSTTHIALHLLGGKPLAGDATLATTFADFTAQAKSQNASQVRVVQSKCTSLWFIFPPFSIFITPVITNVAGEAIQ